MIIDRLIIGTCPSSSYSKAVQDLIKRIVNSEEFALHELIFQQTDPSIIAILLFNYPLVNESYYKEFAEAVKKISLGKYTFCKKSSAFKENFNKLLNELFNKFHSTDLKEQKDQIQKVKYAVPLSKFISELYNIGYIVNCNIKFFLEILLQASETSKISENSLQVLIANISDHAKNEAKQFHKHNHSVHAATITKILAECEGNFIKSSSNNKNNKK